MKWIHKILGLFLVKPFFKLFFRLRVEGKENLKNLSGPLLIISNHKFFLDAFAFGAAIPISANIYPIRFMGDMTGFNDSFVKFLEKIRVVKLVYLLFGVFPAIRSVGLEKSLEIPKDILEKKGIVFLFPEGQMVRENDIGQFKRGAPALALMTNVKILPVAIMLEKESFRRKYHVKFGPVFTLPQNFSHEQGADYMRSVVEDLYNSFFSQDTKML